MRLEARKYLFDIRLAADSISVAAIKVIRA